MKELRNLCLAVIVVAGILDTSAAVFSGKAPSLSLGKSEPAVQVLASNP